MIENIEQAKERLKEIVDFYKLNDENNYDYPDDVLISMKLVLEENKRLNNIINELEKFICDLEIECNIDNSMWGVAVIIHNKLKELKGEDKE